MKEIKISTANNKVLTKEQVSFNKLLQKVEVLQKRIAEQQKNLDIFLKIYNDEIPAIEQKVAESQVKMANQLSNSTLKYKFGKRQQEDLGRVIVSLLNEAFCVITPDEKTEQLYDKWADTSFKEESDAQMATMRMEMEELLREQMGFDIDLSDFEESEDYMKRFHEKMQEELEKKRAEEAANPQKEKKKTKKQLEKELQLKQEEDIKLKSVRNIYISLAKVLHPDTESDPAEKALKEELMKKVTVAYQEKDLPTLLKLEMEWVASESNNVDKLSTAKLKLYISALKEQVAELEDENAQLSMHPRYVSVSRLCSCTEIQGRSELKKIKAQHKNQLESINDMYMYISQPNAKKEIVEFVKQSIEVIDERDLFDGFFDDYF